MKIKDYSYGSWDMVSTISNYPSGYTDYLYTPSTEEILDQLDIKDIENYVRKKKIKRITGRTVKRKG